LGFALIASHRVCQGVSYMATKQRLAQALCVVAFLLLPLKGFCDDSAIERELDLIRQQNRVLQQQVKALTDKVNALESQSDNSESQRDYAGISKTNKAVFPTVKIGAQGGLGWEIANTGNSSSFFIDDVKLSLAARLTPKIDFFTDINLNTFEAYIPPGFFNNTALTLNEIYLDFRDVLEPFGYGSWLNVRAGQFYIPFGEEYRYRYPFENPLVFRSVPDIWGISPGLELYGSGGRWSYALAVQNRQRFGDFGDADKSVAGHIRFDANERFNVMFSAMRTGNLPDGSPSALAFDSGYFTTPREYVLIPGPFFMQFVPMEGVNHVELFELAPQFKWNKGYVKAWGGIAMEHPEWHLGGFGNFHRNTDDYYYSVEAVHEFLPRVYAAARVSQVFAPNSNHMRLSAGLGYHFNSHLTLKTDFSYDRVYYEDVGQVVNLPSPVLKESYYRGAFAAELAFRF
jgi:hypothetical protein